MSRLRDLWFESPHLEAGAPDLRGALAAHGPLALEEILAAGDRLAAVSLTLAQQYCRRAPGAWAVGEGRFRRWVSLGERLAAGTSGAREGAFAYFTLDPAALLLVPDADLELWVELALRVLRASRRLGEAFVAASGPVLAELDRRPARLGPWVEEGVGLASGGGWEGELLALHFFEASGLALALFAPEDFHVWAALGRAAEGIGTRAEFFASAPRALHDLTEADRGTIVRLAREAAEQAPVVALEVYFSLPGTLAAFPGEGAALVASLAPVVAAAPATLADLLPVLRAILEETPERLRAPLVALAGAIASRFPEGVVPFYRVLPRLLERTGLEGIERWVGEGLRIAAENPGAGRVYFGLGSRTSRAVLSAESTAVDFAEVQGLVKRYLHMLTGRSWRVGSAAEVRYRPPFASMVAAEARRPDGETAAAAAPVASPEAAGRAPARGRGMPAAAPDGGALAAASAPAPRLGGPATRRGTLAQASGDEEIDALFPPRADLFPTAEANLRLYRLVAAQHAGRLEFGSEGLTPPIPEFLASFAEPQVGAELFAIFEGARVDAALARTYRGLGADLHDVADELARGRSRLSGTLEHLGQVLRDARRWDLSRRLPEIAERLAAAAATVRESAEVTRTFYAELMRRGAGVSAVLGDTGDVTAFETLSSEELVDARLLLDAEGELVGDGALTETGTAEGRVPDDAEAMPFELAPELDEGSGGMPIDPAELLRLLRRGAEITVKQGRGEDLDALGLYVSDLAGKLPKERVAELHGLLRQARTQSAGGAGRASGEGEFLYDEWDYQIADYRHAWCRLAEIALESDTGDFFHHTLAAHAELLPEVRRQFQRIRPERYRIVHGLEDGEEIDLNAAVTARADRRSGCAPSPKLYQARQREERDVATLFLLDMSASTDEPVPGAAAGRRVIDITKEALVIMAEALEEIGDTYGIYGFSGHGRHQVEFYVVKHFTEPLSGAVKGRVGAIEPKRSTRMGAALRHAVAKMRGIAARSKHVLLLSDGFPQDLDYGDDRRSNTYGIQDTMTAFQEATRAGVTPFCITVDKAGHDYLKEICEASRYLVIEDIRALPRELPKIYQRFVRP